MDRHRGDRHGGNDGGDGDGNYSQGSYYSLRPSRFSDGPPRGLSRFSDGSSRFSDGPTSRYFDDEANPSGNYNRRRSPRSYRGGGSRSFESPPHGPRGGGFPPMGGSDGGGFRPMEGGGGGFGPNFREPVPALPHHSPLSGHKRGFGRGSPDRFDSSFAKLFVGSVPRTATEADIRPLFEKHGHVIEVALIKDKRTGQQQGCCFIKYATSGEADRAIKALHNQHTLPGGVGPIQVRYADGERERLGAVEYKLFVGSLNKRATEKEVEEIFARYGCVEDVYLMRDDMKQSRGCGFVKYLHRDMALAAINALNGIYTMRGCDQPLTVRFADPKRPRPGESRGGPAPGGPGFGPRFQAPGPRPPPSFGGSIHDQVPPTAWDLMSSQNLGPPPNTDVSSFGRSSDLARPLNQGAPLGGPSDGALPGLMDSTAKQSFSQHVHQAPPVSQQISPLQKPLLQTQHLPPSLQLYPQPASYSQAQTSYVNQPQHPLAAGQIPCSQPLISQHSLGLGGHLSTSQPPLQQGLPFTTALQTPLNIQSQSQSQFHSSSVANIQQLPAPVQHQLLQSCQQSPQLAQMLSQQTQTLQASFQSSQQAFSQLQQQVQMMQPSHQGLSLQQGSQATKQQWPGMAPQSIATTAATPLPIDVSQASAPTASVVTKTVPVKYNWTEHTSPEGFKYYYNSVTRESQWEKPEELALVDQQQSQPQQQQLQLKHSAQQPQNQSYPQVLPAQKLPQAQPVQFQAQNHQQQPSFSSLGPQAAQEMWKNKPTGT